MMSRDEFLFCLTVAACVAINYIATDIYLPALPLLRTFFMTSTVSIQTTVSIYMFSIVIAQFVMGPLADHYGFKQTAIPLAILFMLASLLCLLARTIIVLDLGRLLQAFAAGGMTVIGRASFSRYFPAKRALSLYMSIIPVVGSMSPALAPLVGGLLAQHFNWQSIFMLLIVLGALTLWGLIFKYPIGRQTATTTSLHPGFIIKSYFSLLANRHLLAFLTIIMTTFSVYYAYMIEAPFIFHRLGYSVKQISFSYLSIGFGFLLTTQIARRLLRYFSFKTILHLGFSLVILGLVILLWLSLEFKLTLLSIVIPATLYTSAIGFLNPIAMGKSIALFPQKSGYASSLVGASALFGAALGTQFVHLVTAGSVRHLAIDSLLIIFITWLLFIFLSRS